MHVLPLNPLIYPVETDIDSPILQIRELRLGEVKWLAPGTIAQKGRGRIRTHGRLASKPMCFPRFQVVWDCGTSGSLPNHYQANVISPSPFLHVRVGSGFLSKVSLFS